MIQWQKYDPNHSPEIEKEYLIYAGNGVVNVAWLEKWDDSCLVWVETQNLSKCSGVTHYAEIDLPGDHVHDRNESA